MDGDVALLVAVAPVARRQDRRSLCRCPALSRSVLKIGMEQEAHGETAGLQLAQHRVDQEGHVVVEDLEHGAPRAPPRGRPRHASRADLVPAPGLVGDELQRLADVGGQPVGRQAFEAAQPIAGIEQRGKQRGLRSLAQRLLHLADETACRCLGVERHGDSLPVAKLCRRQLVNPPVRIDNADNRPLNNHLDLLQRRGNRS